MLNINLLSQRIYAEQQYRKMLRGEICDFVTMLQDTVVRRRVHQQRRREKQQGKSSLHRDKHLSFDGRYEGPLNKSEVKTSARLDRGYQPMPIDVHVRPIARKRSSMVTVEDHDWAERQPSIRKRSLAGVDSNVPGVMVDRRKSAREKLVSGTRASDRA